MNEKSFKEFFDYKAAQYNQPDFVKDDPISIPHLFTKKQDIEIAALFAATFAWGNRTTIINKSRELMRLMDMSPHDFILNHSDQDLKQVLHFKHRTFNSTDLLYFIEFLKSHYKKYPSLENAFTDYRIESPLVGGGLAGAALTGFHHYFFPSIMFRSGLKNTLLRLKRKVIVSG